MNRRGQWLGTRHLRLDTAILALTVTLIPTTAVAQPTTEDTEVADAETPAVERARQHFLRGVEFYRESDYRAAIIEFERAYKTAPNYKVLYNMGQAHLELQDYAAALDAFEKYLSEGGDDLSAEQREVVEGEVEKLSGRVARANVSVNVVGATVLIDDVVIGKSPLAKPITVSTGRRKLTIQKEGYLPITQRIDVAGGDALELSFSLTPTAKAAPVRPAAAPVAPSPAASPAPSAEQDRGMGTPFWVSLTATGVFAAGAGVLGYMALSAKRENGDQLGSASVHRTDLEDSKSDTERFALGTDILLGATALAGGLTIYFALDGRDEPGSSRVGIAPGGAVLSGSF